jgi:hypothetical protein
MKSSSLQDGAAWAGHDRVVGRATDRDTVLTSRRSRPCLIEAYRPAARLIPYRQGHPADNSGNTLHSPSWMIMSILPFAGARDDIA